MPDSHISRRKTRTKTTGGHPARGMMIVFVWGAIILGGADPDPTRAAEPRPAVSEVQNRAASSDKVLPIANLQAVPFSLEDVSLLDGPFKHAMELDRTYVLSLDPDRLLLAFRLNAGIPSNARPYGGWMALRRSPAASLSDITCRLAARCMRAPATGNSRRMSAALWPVSLSAKSS